MLGLSKDLNLTAQVDQMLEVKFSFENPWKYTGIAFVVCRNPRGPAGFLYITRIYSKLRHLDDGVCSAASKLVEIHFDYFTRTSWQIPLRKKSYNINMRYNTDSLKFSIVYHGRDSTKSISADIWSLNKYDNAVWFLRDAIEKLGCNKANDIIL